MSLKTYQKKFGGRVLKVEIGEVAKQAKASVMVSYGESTVMSVVTASKEATDRGFFPLMVVYQEKLYSAGKIPGGFLRREGRPSEHETLTSRLIDRPIRPLFPKGFMNEVQVINTVLSSDTNASPEMASFFGTGLILNLSDIPFHGPVAAVHIGRVDGSLVVNPNPDEMKKSDLDLIVAGTKEAINMVESGAKEVSEKDMLEAILYAHEMIRELCDFQLEILKDYDVKKMDFEVLEPSNELTNEVKELAEENLKKAVSTQDKLERYKKIDEIKSEILDKYELKPFFKELDGVKFLDFERNKLRLKFVKEILDEIVTKETRRLITEDKIRPDGRGLDEIRELSNRIDVLKRTHGSALFTRGQTQALGVVTLGALRENQLIDGIRPVDTKRFMLHYNFPPFSVGETGRYGFVGRREVGHGALGERALLQVLPDEEEFPYTIRVVSEILESNGSSSQATICAGSLALMAAGVPIKSAVAGIAMGLIMDDKNYSILTDIQGMEDHEGDMDFKVAGTDQGITALQMDIKIKGINEDILKEALEQARVARLEILENMNETIRESRKELSQYAPKVKLIKIKPDKIRDVIGSGGKIISQIIEEHDQIKIDIEQDGRIFLMHHDSKTIETVSEKILNLVREAKVGEIYEGKVKRIEKFGCFVELWPGTEGLVHISKLAKERVEKVEDIVSLNDQILVKCIKIDDKGRVDLSRKDALKN
jgi:polyribonucleotide nucleotidyltransferase